jgi:hypothetical protein
MPTTTEVGSCCCVPAQRCCCDENGPRTLTGEDECSNETFPVPDPPKTVSLVFEWCGLTGEWTTAQGGIQSYYDDEVIDEFVCNTTGRYGEGVESYTKATFKQLSVSIGETTGGVCGVSQDFVISGGMSGVGFRLMGDGSYAGWETPVVSELYSCTFYQCFDGSEADITMTLTQFTPDDTCGGTGNFDPCKFTTPELTVVVAP